MAPTLQNFVNSFSTRLEPSLKQHLVNVYGCLSLSAISAVVGAYVHMYTNIMQAGFLPSLAALGLVFALITTQDDGKNRKLRLGYLLGVSFFTGLGLGPLLEAVIRVNPSIIVTAFLGAAVVFVSFSISAIMSERGKWLYLGGSLISVLNAMIVLSLANFFFRSEMLYSIHLYLGLIVMSAFIIYDTQVIMEKHRVLGSKDFIGHSLDLFLDLVGVFRYLLVILTEKEKSSKRKK